jgi:hypothetical protein
VQTQTVAFSQDFAQDAAVKPQASTDPLDPKKKDKAKDDITVTDTQCKP